jgi:hypothetical protein
MSSILSQLFTVFCAVLWRELEIFPRGAKHINVAQHGTFCLLKMAIEEGKNSQINFLLFCGMLDREEKETALKAP